VVVRLHGVGNWPPSPQQASNHFLIEPSDPHLTYWWGYSERLPQASALEGAVPPYTARRVLALLEWVLRTWPGADPARVFVEGDSMGGAGSLTLGLLYARHFTPRTRRRWHARTGPGGWRSSPACGACPRRSFRTRTAWASGAGWI
jgi:hypothetical protein